ncbi:hypothetical protein MCOR25_010722 [Pyricularia grisea]|nr:hypothetical protein MCOR25_010722 [Pyricularia grisea]
MEFVPGDTVMDSFGGYEVHRGQIPQHHKPSFVRQVAKLQVEMASVRFPQIGTVIKQHNGSYTIGPLPILGGPFSTAAEYFKAWAQHAKFPKSEAELQRYIPEGLEELKSSILDFPSFLAAAADQIPLLDGPFPLYHPDFRHSNIIVDANCNVLSVIDWENASTVPWEIVQPPLFLSTVPAPMNLPSGYDENCLPIDPEERRSWQDVDDYVRFTREVEVKNRQDHRLSTTLGNQTVQNLAGALKLYLDPGKLGFYCKVLDQFSADARGNSV